MQSCLEWLSSDEGVPGKGSRCTAALLLACCAWACKTPSGASRDTQPSGVFEPMRALGLPLTPPASVALDPAGNSYFTGTLGSKRPVDLAGKQIAAVSDGALVVASLDSAGQLRWAQTVDAGATQGNSVLATGVALTGNGRVIFSGHFSGRVAFGESSLETDGNAELVGAVDAADGRKLWASRLSLGSNGILTAIAANPRSAVSRFAVCGQASAAAKDLAPGAIFGGGIHDLVIAVFDSDGRRVWSAQLGGAGTESCTALALDESGDVYAAGQFDGESLSFPGAPAVTVTGPGTAAGKAMWVAKFSGAGAQGAIATLAAASFKGATGQVRPRALALGADGALFVAGQFTSSLAFTAAPCSGQSKPPPRNCLIGAGDADAFVARLDASSLAPQWAVRLGGTGRDEAYGLATTASGEVLAVGRASASLPFFKQANGGVDTSGAAQLQITGTTNPDGFLLELDGRSGETRHAEVYGDDAFDSAESIAVGPVQSGAERVAIGGTVGQRATFGAAGAVTSTILPGLATFLLFGELRQMPAAVPRLSGATR